MTGSQLAASLKKLRDENDEQIYFNFEQDTSNLKCSRQDDNLLDDDGDS